jgi:hypothetical protein
MGIRKPPSNGSATIHAHVGQSCVCRLNPSLAPEQGLMEKNLRILQATRSAYARPSCRKGVALILFAAPCFRTNFG